MKYLITLYELNNLEKLLELADGVIVGNKRLSSRLTRSFTLSEINKVIKITKSLNKEVYLKLNKMLEDDDFLVVDKFLAAIDFNELTGVIISDLGLLYYLTEKGFAERLVYDPDTLLANSFDFNYYANDAIKGAVIAKEIALDDIKKIINNKKYETYLYGHGYINMFYTKRKLIKNFKNKYHLSLDPSLKTYRLKEEKRNEYYPILEEPSGTSVFRANVLNSLNELKELKGLDYFIIDTIFHDDNYGLDVLKLYQGLTTEDLEAKYEETWDSGFYYEKTVLRK